MKRFPLLLAAGLVLLLLEAGLTWADTVRFRLGPPHGHIVFKATSRLVDADGRFHRFGGDVRVDPKALEQAGEDFFHVARYPQITFTSRRVAPADGKILVWSSRGERSARAASSRSA